MRVVVFRAQRVTLPLSRALARTRRFLGAARDLSFVSHAPLLFCPIVLLFPPFVLLSLRCPPSRFRATRRRHRRNALSKW